MISDFENFVKNKKEEEEKNKTFKVKTEKLVHKVQNFMLLNRSAVNVCAVAAKTLTEFAVNGSPFTLVEGGINVVKTFVIDKYFYATDFFSEANGWKSLSEGSVSFDGLFDSTINKFPVQSLKFRYDGNQSVKMIELPMCRLGVIKSQGTQSYHQIFYEDKYNISEILEFLINEKLQDLQTNFISVDFKNATPESSFGIDLISEKIYPVDSIKSEFYTKYVINCLELGHNRSLIFNGSPGTGKTTLSQTIINNLGFRTLKFRYNKSYNFNLFAFIVHKFKIEAVIIDDMDQIDARDELLEFLEMIKKETKLVIGLVNSLKDFHPALIRPGRFDEIITVEALDPKVVRHILGPTLSKKYFTKVKNWPVAYINELVIRSKFLNTVELAESCKELGERVKKALALKE